MKSITLASYYAMLGRGKDKYDSRSLKGILEYSFGGCSKTDVTSNRSIIYPPSPHLSLNLELKRDRWHNSRQATDSEWADARFNISGTLSIRTLVRRNPAQTGRRTCCKRSSCVVNPVNREEAL